MGGTVGVSMGVSKTSVPMHCRSHHGKGLLRARIMHMRAFLFWRGILVVNLKAVNACHSLQANWQNRRVSCVV